METLTLGLLLLAAVLASSVVDQLVPKVSLPLIQIGMGVVIALFASTAIDIELDPDLFLVLFIAPLLYDEAKNADKALLWRDKKPILSLAIGLVVVTTLAIGFAVHAVVPTISLAAAFALGAALGPTDAVAVTSLSKEVDIPERQKSILRGELLLNDASGIVAFQFALAAAITGAFSFVGATTSFLVEFFGGLLFGAALGFIGNFIVRRARALGVENTTFHVLFEVLTPLLVYLIADACHVSGIIAVVVAGLMNVISPRLIGPQIARMNIVSSNVWHVLSFALNGIVFVLLGTQLPNAMRHSWDDVAIHNTTLVLYVIGLTLLLFAVRFLWCMAMEIVFVKRVKKRRVFTSDIKTALITTLCGAKGTITLSILFTIPVYLAPGVRFPQRDLIIFLACGVIVCTLLVATFIVPLLSPKKDTAEDEAKIRERDVASTVEIMRNVIEELTAHRTPENRRATTVVIKAYNERIAHIKDINDIEDEPNVALRIKAIHWEQEYVEQQIQEGAVSSVVGYRYLKRLDRSESLLEHSDGRISPRRIWLRIRPVLRGGLFAFLDSLPNSDSAVTAQAEELRELQIAAEIHVVEKLNAMISTEIPTEDVAAVLLEYQRSIATLRNSRPSISTSIRIADRTNDVKKYAYQVELEQIQTMYEEGRLSRAAAKRLRESVYLMQLDLEGGSA